MSDINAILEAVQALTPDEQRQLRANLDQRLAEQDEAARLQAFHQALIKSGLVTAIKPAPVSAPVERRLIEVKGKPLSETIIEERR
jgi:hypothetical protein